MPRRSIGSAPVKRRVRRRSPWKQTLTMSRRSGGRRAPSFSQMAGRGRRNQVVRGKG